MSFEDTKPITNNTVQLTSNEQKTNRIELEDPVFNSPTPLNEMLQNKELLTCYRCKETFNIEDEHTDQDQKHSLDSNNIILGIILNKKTPSSICLNCLSHKMMEVMTEKFTKNSKDYQGMFFSYEHKFQG